MELNTISNTGSWGNSANRLNENFSKVNTEVEKLKNATTKNKGYFKTDALLKQTHQTAYYGDIAYVGTSYPYQIWTWNGTNWEDSQSTGGDEIVNLGNYYTREDIDTQQQQQNDSLAAITEKQTTQENKIIEVEKTLKNLEVAGVDVASADKLGGIKAETKTDAETAEAKIDPVTGKLYVPAGGNNPDNEDLEEKTNEEGTKVIQFADKEYNAAGFSGLGRLYLRMAISASKNVLTQEMISKANTRYIIQYDYDLGGETINIPNGCVLDFQGGSLSNGIITGNLTKISSYPTQIFNDITISGSWIINNAYSEWFGAKGDNSTDDTEAIQKCLDSFYKCKLLSKTYAVTSIKLPNNSMLEGFDLGREKMATIRQIDSYSGDLITTGNTSYSGVVLKYFRITGGQQNNFAITITVPQSYIYKVTTDLYHGSGIHLSERAWITVIDSCSLFGNINDAATRSTISYAIKIDSAGGLVKVLNCNINYYIVGVAIVRGDQVTVCNTNISECSQNQFPKLPLYAVWVINGKSVDIFDNYIENFNTGIRIEGGTKINIHDNFINGLQAAPFGIDITGEINGLNIQDNYIYTGYTGAKCIRAISVTGENTIRIVRNNLDETKLYGCENFYFETYSNITDFRKVVGYPITIKKISDIYESISGNVYNIPSNISRVMYSIEDRSSYSDIGTTLTYKLPISTTVKEGSIIIFDKGKEDKYYQTTIDAGNEIITGMDQPGNRSQILSITGMTGTIALIAKYGYWQVLWCTGTWIYKNGFKSSSENYRPTENLKKGDFFFNETSNKMQVYNGTSWYTLAAE